MSIQLQSPDRPSLALLSLTGVLNGMESAFRIASAYVTDGGVELLLPRLRNVFGSNWDSIDRRAIASLDFGLTSADALDTLVREGFVVRVAATSHVEGNFRPRVASFHPKVYMARLGENWHGIIGSANLTARAFTRNFEAVTSVNVANAEFRDQWDQLWATSIDWTESLSATYREWQARHPERESIDDSSEPPAPIQANAVRSLWEAISAGFAPDRFEYMWVEVGYASGGSGNQLELPRGGALFFGDNNPTYGSGQELVALLDVSARGSNWRDRKLTWHGNNGMERLNLPTPAQSGFEYAYRVVLFQRVAPNRIILRVEDPGSVVADSWRASSRQSGRVFRLSASARSTRLVGFF